MKIYILSFLLFVSVLVHAQNDTVSATGRIVFKQKFYEIDGSANYFLNIMVFNAVESLTTSHKYGMEPDPGSKMVAENGAFTIVPGIYDEKGTQFYRNLTAKEFLMRMKATKPYPAYIVTEPWIAIEWKIEEDYKNLLGYKVQKAIGEFRGRTWTVWFAPDIPVPFGPGKLYGLPGIILEAKDKRFYMIASEICYPCKIDSIIKPEEELKWTLKERVAIFDNYDVHTVLENQKNGLYGLYISKAKTEKEIWNRRNNATDILYEWEDKKTKRAITDRKILNQVIVPKEYKSTEKVTPPPPSLKF